MCVSAKFWERDDLLFFADLFDDFVLPIFECLDVFHRHIPGSGDAFLTHLFGFALDHIDLAVFATYQQIKLPCRCLFAARVHYQRFCPGGSADAHAHCSYWASPWNI